MADYSKIKLVVLDVDGTLTDGGIYYDSNGNEMKRFDVKDGLGIKVGIAAGLEFAIITGRKSPMVERRASELGIEFLVQGEQQKSRSLSKLMAEIRLAPSEVCFIGDDWNDMQCMKSVGVSMCPADAADEIQEICSYVAPTPGGKGAVRACIKELLKQTGKWERACESVYGIE